MEEKQVGKVTHFFDRISVAVVELSDNLKVGETIHFKSDKTDFTQIIGSMQVEHQNIEEAKMGESIGLKTEQPVRVGDLVYKIVE